jgi:hypothetical protein
VGDVVSQNGAVRVVQSDFDGLCAVEIRSTGDVYVESVDTPGRVTIIENDLVAMGACDEKVQSQLTDSDEPIQFGEEQEHRHFAQVEYESSIGPRIMGTELYCNYDLWSIRDYESVQLIKGHVVFEHRGSKKQLITEFTGIALGPTKRQVTSQVSGTNIREINPKIVADFEELMNWVRIIDQSLSR